MKKIRLLSPLLAPLCLVASALATFLLGALLVTSSAAAGERPNVVLILSDDQGWRDYGFMGHEIVETPHLDRLAKRSMVFERGYVPAPLCRPSLASIVTGRYPHQHGVCANDVSPTRGPQRKRENQPVFEHFHRQPSLIRTLVEHGYLAHQSGKWWEGSWQDGGFTHGMTHGDPTRGGRHGDRGLTIGRQGIDEVTKFIDEAVAADKPFFVWYAPFMPHTPHTPPAEILKKYADHGLRPNVARYYAMCEWFDQSCGRLLDHLQQRGLGDNTIVLYLSDNGWSAVDPRADNPEGWWPDYAPRSKGSPFELGIRTPIMISWPGHVKPGRSRDLASSIDLLPTTLTACGIAPPADLPGINLLSAEARRRRDAIFGAAYSIHNMSPGDPASTLQYRWGIEGKWKLLLRSHGVDTTRYKTIHEWDDVPLRLYDLESDPAEQRNVADQHPDVVERLTQRIEAEIPGN